MAMKAAEIRAALDSHKRWLAGKDGHKATFHGVDLSREDLSRADLSKADLSKADLSGACLSKADLSRASLKMASLQSADLQGASLRGTILQLANLDWARVSGANLSDADLSKADLSNANLSNAILSNAILRGADLQGANLIGTILSNADLSNADLSNAILSKTDLSGASFDGADLSGTCLDPDTALPIISDEDLASAQLTPRTVKGRERVYGVRARHSLYIGEHVYTPGRFHVAPVLSTDRHTECHPGVYLGGTEITNVQANDYIEKVNAWAYRDECFFVSAQLGVRCRRIWVLR